MTQGQVPPAITKEGLLAKSRVYIQRAFRAKQANDLDEYQLWASLALELLGKAALARIHPSLVVDPNHYESLFAASGINISTDIKTIGAGTLYKRLNHLSKYFDYKVKEFCDTISLRRNSELHSGELPFQQMLLDAWEGWYWQAADIIVGMLARIIHEGYGRSARPQVLGRGFPWRRGRWGSRFEVAPKGSFWGNRPVGYGGRLASWPASIVKPAW